MSSGSKASVGTAYIQIVPSMKGIGASIEKTLNSELGNVGRKAGQTLSNSMMDTVAKSAGKIGKAIMPASLAVGGAMAASLKSGATFTDQMAKVSTIADTSQVSLKDLSKGVMNLSNQSGKSTKDLAEALYQALSASVKTKDSIKFLSQATKLSRGGFTSTTTAVDVLSTIINAYGMKAKDATKISDILIQTQNKGKTTVDLLGRTMGTVIPTASALNVNLENVAAAYSIMTRNGINTNIASTYIRATLNELSKKAKQAKDGTMNAAGIIKQETGKTFGQLMKEGWSLGDVLQVLMKHVHGNTEEFKNLFQNQRAGQGALAMMSGGVKGFNKELKGMENATGNTAKAVEKMNTPAHEARKALNSLKNIGTTLGQTWLASLAPVLKTVADGVKKAADAFANLPAPVQNAIGIAGAVIAVAGPALLGFSKMIQAVNDIRTGFAMLKGIGGLVSGEFGSTIQTFSAVAKASGGLKGILSGMGSAIGGAMKGIASTLGGVFKAIGGFLMTPPWGIVVAIAAAVAAFILLYKHNEKFRNFVNGIVDAVKGALQGAVEWLKGVWEGIKGVFQGIGDFFSGIGEGIKGKFQAFVEWFQGIWDTIKNVVKVAIMLIAEILKAAFTIITLPFRFIWENCKQFIIPIWEGIKNTVSNALQWIWNVIQTIGSTIAQVWQTIWGGIVNFFKTIWSGIVAFFTPIIQAISNVITNVINGIKSIWETVWGGIKTFFVNVWNGIKGVVEPIINNIKAVIENTINAIKSVWETVWGAIKNFFSNIWGGIKSAAQTGINAVKSVIEPVLNAIKTFFENIWNGIKTFFSNVWTNLKNVASKGINAVKTAVTAPLNAIKKLFKTIWDGATRIVQNAVNKLKNIVNNLKWHLPKLKLPHFSVTGKLSLDPPSVPHFSVKWYKQAMNQPYMFDNATLFGAGEAGDEMMYGRAALMDDISQASGANEMLSRLDSMIKYMQAILTATDRDIVLDSGQLVSALAPGMNSELGTMARRRRRS